MAERPAGHRALVRRLYEEHGASLYRYASILLADPVAAEDAIQQVFTALLRRPGPIENEANYLRRAVRNECYSHLRMRQRREAMAGDRPLLEPVAPAGIVPDERLALQRVIGSLPPEQREVIHLHVFEGWTFQQIADASEASINTVAARYRYALEKMRSLLMPHE
jgi:RNA polymerase sigma-70 factor (ECF subfamily)